MSIQLTLNFDSVKELHEAVSRLSSETLPATLDTTEEKQSAPKKKRRGRPPKSEQKQEENGKAEEKKAEPEPKNPADDGMTFEELKKICAESLKSEGREFITQIFADYQIERLSDLDPGQYADFAEYMRAASSEVKS